MTLVAPSEYAADGKYSINKFIDFVRDRSAAGSTLAYRGPVQ